MRIRDGGTLFCAILASIAMSCSESSTPTAPEPSPDQLASIEQASKGGGNTGGKASPHFVNEETTCNFDSATGHMVCDYQVAGLGKYGRAVITLAGVETLSYRCWIFTIDTVRFFAEIEVWADRSGNYRGTIDAAPLLGPACNNSVSWGATDDWLLSGLADTAAGTEQLIVYSPPG